LAFDDDFEEIFDDFDSFNKFIKKSQRELNKILERIKNGEIKGTWEIKEIDEPGVTGYTIRGSFRSDEPLEPLEPLKPLRRRPLPERPFEVPETATKEIREPLTDIFEEDNAIKIYVELPGEEKDDIKMDIQQGYVNIEAKNLRKTIKLPNRQVVAEAASSEYKNGVLIITIPTRKELRQKDTENAQMV